MLVTLVCEFPQGNRLKGGIDGLEGVHVLFIPS